MSGITVRDQGMNEASWVRYRAIDLLIIDREHWMQGWGKGGYGSRAVWGQGIGDCGNVKG